jgi:hypothetical protein
MVMVVGFEMEGWGMGRWGECDFVWMFYFGFFLFLGYFGIFLGY